MRLLAVAIVALALAGCDLGAMSNDEIIAATRKCQAAGFDVGIHYNLLINRITAIECWPKEGKEK